MRDNLIAIKRAIEAGADPDAREAAWSHTALMTAAMHGSLGAARMLAPISDLTLRGMAGADALMIAAHAKHAAVVEELAPLFDLAARDMHGFTALGLAVYSGCPRCVAALLPGSSLDAVDGDGLSGEELARSKGWEEVAILVGAERAKRAAAELDAELPAGRSRGRRPGM